jgi:hypothetical protein
MLPRQKVTYESPDGRWRIVKPDPAKRHWIVQERAPAYKAGEPSRYQFRGSSETARGAREQLDLLASAATAGELGLVPAVGGHEHSCGHKDCRCLSWPRPERCAACEMVQALTSWEPQPNQALHHVLRTRFIK